ARIELEQYTETSVSYKMSGVAVSRAGPLSHGDWLADFLGKGDGGLFEQMHSTQQSSGQFDPPTSI
ncbi:hypothetical protein JYU34_015354, partial [Plutella xylostella]